MSFSDTALALSHTSSAIISLPIKAVEKETGISKELLRMWERRYGFPCPSRDSNNDRMYPKEQIERLRIIRRLIDAGFRPGKIITLSLDDLKGLVTHQEPSYAVTAKLPTNLQKDLTNVLKSRNKPAVTSYLTHHLVSMGLESFVLNFLPHTNTFVGDAWMRGELNVAEEHLYTEIVAQLINNAIASLGKSKKKPRVMLTTAHDEPHNLNALMIESLLRIDRVDAVNYGHNLSFTEIRREIQKHDVEVVLLSFSGAYPTNRAIDFLEALRLQLPLRTEIWASGSALQQTRKSIDGIIILDEMTDIKNRILFWQRQHGQLRH